MRVAVVGHIEWVQFAVVDRVPRQGEIVHASDHFEDAGGGGAVAAVQLRKLAGAALFLTAVGSDELGERARAAVGAHGVEVHAAVHDKRQRRAFTFLDSDGERTITVIGERLAPHGGDPLPWERLARMDAVYLTAGDAEAVRAARAARILVATPRVGPALAEAKVPVDVLVHSARDAGEPYHPGDLDPPPRWVVSTSGSAGGAYSDASGEHRYAAAELPGPVVDAYGCGDSFAAGLTFALARGDSIEEALQFAARCGAACLTGRGPYAGQLELT